MCVREHANVGVQCERAIVGVLCDRGRALCECECVPPLPSITPLQAVLHGVQGVAVLAAGLGVSRLRDFKLPLNTSFPDWSKGYPVATIQASRRVCVCAR